MLDTRYLSLTDYKTHWNITTDTYDIDISRAIYTCESIVDALTNESIANNEGLDGGIITTFQKARVLDCLKFGAQFFMTANNIPQSDGTTDDLGTKSITLGDLSISKELIDEVSRTLSNKDIGYPITSIGTIAYNELVRSGLACRRI